MSIEEDINQKEFPNEYRKGIVNFTYTFNWMNERVKKILDKENITSQQFNILRILRGSGQPLSTLQIRQRMLDKMSDTSRIVDRLVLKELVKKSICPTDRRLVDISISEKGMKLLEKTDKYDKQIDDIFGNLSLSEVQTLNSFLDKIRKK